MKRLKGIKTIDDLLSEDDVNEIMNLLVKAKAGLTGIVAITINREQKVQVLSSLDRDGTLGVLTRASTNLALGDWIGWSDGI